MSRSARSTYHHGDLRHALLQAGRAVLAERGVDGLSLREVARRAEVSQAAPYHHFTDKAALVGAIAEQGFADFTAALRAAAGEAGEAALPRFMAMGLAYVRFAVANPDLFRLLFRPELRQVAAGPAAQAVARAELAAYDVFLDAIRAAIAEGSVRGEVDDVAVVAWSSVHGLATLIVDGPIGDLRRPPDELAKVVLMAVGTGIASERLP